jgi:serine/threonine-protein kinase
MSEKKSEASTSAPPGERAGSHDSDFESWLRVAARMPDEPRRVPLPHAGQIIGGKYRIDGELGRGGMGAVYGATHTVSGKQVALKWMLRPASDERARQRFMREARAAARVDHPNVVDVYDLGEEGEAGFLVMELLHGESLRARLARGRLVPAVAVELLLPALRGVAAAHRHGVIHRDLKPDNVFLCRSPEGEAREAKILDFGVSAITAPEHEAQTTLTKDGTLLGTPMYMSPEQLESSKDIDARTDVYALGVILYEALTGARPFAGDSYSALVLAIANSQPKPLRELCPEIPEGLERVVLRAMHRDKAERLPSVEALIAALSPFASTPGSASAAHAAPEPALPRSTRGRSMRAPLWAVVVLAAAGFWWWVARTGAPPSRARDVTRSPPARTAAPALEPAAAAATVPMPAATAEPAAGNPVVTAPRPLVPVDSPRGGRATRTDSRPRPPPPVAPTRAPAQAPPARSGRITVGDL